MTHSTQPSDGRNPSARRSNFRHLRIAVLSSVLAIVLLYAYKDVTRRRERTTWERTLNVAIVLLRSGPVDREATEILRKRAPDLESRLAAQMDRHAGRRGVRPFAFTVYGPEDISELPPSPKSNGGLDLALHAFRAWRYFRDVDSRADVPTAGFDSRLYLVIRPVESARRKVVEGQSEQGGRVGQVAVELDASMVDFALIVATHELFHTLGATDKYDAFGRCIVPDGLANPQQSPLYPQVAAEVMARNVALSPTDERPPDRLDELVVGEKTAAEIGWLSLP